MEHSTIAIIIIIFTIISFALEKIPLSMTAMISAMAMGIFGIIEIPQVYSTFGSEPVMLVVGMMIVSDALFENGVAQGMGNKMLHLGFGKSEKIFLMAVIVLSAFLSAFASNSAVVAMFIPIIGAVSANSNGKITCKNTLMATGMAAGAGGFCTLAGSTPQILAQGIFSQTEGMRSMSFFELSKVGIPVVLIMVAYFATVGYSLSKKVLKFDDVQIGIIDDTASEQVFDKKKQIFTSIVALGCVAGFVSGIWTIGMVSIVGATILITTGCISLKKAFLDIDWNTIVVVAVSQSFAKGLDVSGAGKIFAESILKLFGSNATPMIILAVIVFVTVALTNFMSNVAVCSMILPIALSLAVSLGVNPMSFGIGVVIACQIAFATPIGTACVTQTLVGGYHYMDYVKIGLPITLIMTVVCIVLIPIMYGF